MLTEILKKQIIFILDDEEHITSLLKKYINKTAPRLIVHVFNKYTEMLNHKLLKDCSLFIIDIDLECNLKGDVIAENLFKSNLYTPFLFISGGTYKFERFQQYQYTYDFIKKPFDLHKLSNKIAVLLKVSATYKYHENEEKRLRYNLREIFDHANIYLLILNSEMNILACSNKLAKDLGYKNSDELINMSWTNFLEKEELERLSIVHDNAIKNTKIFQKSMREITNNIITKKGKSISVKWFNTRIKNGTITGFSIGIPSNRKITSNDEIDSIRAYWKHVIDQDETSLRTLKNITYKDKAC